MLIDWFTVGAQTLNFLILAWLLKRFLYKPILGAIDAREAGIAKKLADAEASKTETLKERDALQRKNEEFDQQRAALLKQATDAAHAERQRLLDEARRAADGVRAQRQDALDSEQRGLIDDIARRTRAEVFAIARKLLTDLAGMTMEECISEMFVRRLRELGGDQQAALAKAVAASSTPVLVRSAFTLSPDQQSAIRQALNTLCSAEIAPVFEMAPNLICGIELAVSGQKVAWSIAAYLGTLEKSVNELSNERDQQQGQPEPVATPATEAKAFELTPSSAPLPGAPANPQ